LALIAWMVFAECLRKGKKEKELKAAGKELDTLATGN